MLGFEHMNTEPFISRSQAGQDLWIKAILVDAMGIKSGLFLDIGASHPMHLSNSYALEQLGWMGLLVDNSEESREACALLRPRTEFYLGDATKINWQGFFIKELEFAPLVDYLSLDVDGATEDSLRHLLGSGIRFRACTIEHDSYRFGLDRAERMRAMMREAGYELICQDVMHDGCAFEDWWVDPSRVDIKAAQFYACIGVDGLRIVSPP